MDVYITVDPATQVAKPMQPSSEAVKPTASETKKKKEWEWDWDWEMWVELLEMRKKERKKEGWGEGRWRGVEA